MKNEPNIRLEVCCEHVTPEHHKLHVMRPGAACVDCVSEGSQWVHLRSCLTCGEVRCCESSARRHARRHYEKTGHALVTSVEIGENWAWCYAHNREMHSTPYQLWISARTAGRLLFGARFRFFGFKQLREVERTKLSTLQALDPEENYLDEHEFVFFPLRGGGLDVSSETWRDAHASWQDNDGRIYTAWSEGIIRIIEVDTQLPT